MRDNVKTNDVFIFLSQPRKMRIQKIHHVWEKRLNNRIRSFFFCKSQWISYRRVLPLLLTRKGAYCCYALQ